MSRQIGLDKFTVAILTKDDKTTITYEEPKTLARAISATVTRNATSDKIFSDDSLEDVINNFNSVDVELNVNDLTLEMRALIQGAHFKEGVLVESKEDIIPEIALGFRSKKTTGHYRYIWLLKGKFNLPEDGFETTSDKITPQTLTINASFGSRDHDGKHIILADEDEAKGTGGTGSTTTQTLIEKWFDGVPTIAADGTVTPATKA